MLFFWWVGGKPSLFQPTAPSPVVTTCVAQATPFPGDYQITDSSPRLAPFSVETLAGSDYLVKLQNIQDWAKSLSFFLHGGQSFETTVPLGSYVLKYAAGLTWCGATELFGNGVIQKGRTLLVFTEDQDGYTGQTVTLFGVPRGNFSTELIPREQF